MHCPVCESVDLFAAEQYGIKVNYCPHCQGIWLDRAELEELVEQIAAMPPAMALQAIKKRAVRATQSHVPTDNQSRREQARLLDDMLKL